MKTLLKVAFPLALGLLVQPSATFAQPGAFNPDMLECGQQGDAEIICGTRAPEDFEVTPDGKFLIIANFGAVTDPALDLFDLASKTFGEIALTAEKREGWGVAACSDSIGAQVSPHGLSLTQRASGEWQLYVVNHNVRESVEMYELQQAGAGWALVWRGCVLADEPYNDVAALADGSFVATRPQAIMHEEQDIFAGAPTGNVALWTAAAGEQVLPGTDTGYPNGVVVSADGRYAYVSGWTTRTFHKYDLTQRKEVAKVDSTFMADNLTWTPAGKILAGGIKGVQGNCPAESENPCLQAMVVAEIDPASLAVTVVHDSAGRALINGTSVAIQAGDAIYVGSFQGDRLVKLPR